MKCTNCGAVIVGKVAAAAPPLAEAVFVPESTRQEQPSAIPTIVPAMTDSVSFQLPPTELISTATRRYQQPKAGWPKWLAGVAGVLVVGLGGLVAYRMSIKPPPKPEGIASGSPAKTTTTITATAGVAMPRRLLVVNVTQYAYLNPLSAGQGARGDAVQEAARKLAFEWRIPADGAGSQFYLLSDSSGTKAPPVVKAVLQPTVERFIETSRKQDRIAIYFGGHAIERDGKAYIAGADGDANDPTTLVPVEAIYDRLKLSPAQQKLVIWDVCRFNPQVGRSMPGSEPMPAALHKVLSSPPAGVQAWITCSPNENAVELTRSGSEFLSAVRSIGDKALGNKGTLPDDPIPAAEWLTATQAALSKLVTADGKPGQTMMLAGAVAGESVAANADEPVPPRFEFPVPPQGADPVKVADAFALLDLPPVRSSQSAAVGAAGQSLYVPAEALAPYLAEAMPVDEAIKQKEKFPIRAAAARWLLSIRNVWKRAEGGDSKSGLRETFVGEANDAVKKSILKEQEVPARIILELEGIITEGEKLEKELDKEPSKRWRATFQYALAQAKARWAYMNEYNLMLGVIQKNELPPLDEKKGETGWAMIGTDSMKSKKDVKEQLEASQELFDKIATEHKGTPWAVLAKQARNAKLGLEWRTVTPDAKRE